MALPGRGHGRYTRECQLCTLAVLHPGVLVMWHSHIRDLSPTAEAVKGELLTQGNKLPWLICARASLSVLLCELSCLINLESEKQKRRFSYWSALVSVCGRRDHEFRESSLGQDQLAVSQDLRRMVGVFHGNQKYKISCLVGRHFTNGDSATHSKGPIRTSPYFCQRPS